VEEVVEQAVPVLGENRLGMELNSMYRVLDMLYAHDLPVVRRGGYPQRLRK
jgi:hypothetical protein